MIAYSASTFDASEAFTAPSLSTSPSIISETGTSVTVVVVTGSVVVVVTVVVVEVVSSSETISEETVVVVVVVVVVAVVVVVVAAASKFVQSNVFVCWLTTRAFLIRM